MTPLIWRKFVSGQRSRLQYRLRSRCIYHCFPTSINSMTTGKDNRTWRPIGLWDVEAPTFSLNNRLIHGGELFALPSEDPWYSFPSETESTPGAQCGTKSRRIDVQNILSADTHISGKAQGHLFGDHLSSESVSVMPSSVIQASIVLCSVSLWLIWVNVQSACALKTRYKVNENIKNGGWNELHFYLQVCAELTAPLTEI
jgi:hypothetical protein